MIYNHVVMLDVALFYVRIFLCFSFIFKVR